MNEIERRIETLIFEEGLAELEVKVKEKDSHVKKHSFPKIAGGAKLSYLVHSLGIGGSESGKHKEKEYHFILEYGIFNGESGSIPLKYELVVNLNRRIKYNIHNGRVDCTKLNMPDFLVPDNEVMGRIQSDFEPVFRKMLKYYKSNYDISK